MIGFLLFIRVKDIPKPAPESPFKHLEERKAAIYENLRDLQFEYRLDKLSDADYQATKLELQKDLAQVHGRNGSHQGGAGRAAARKGCAPGSGCQKERVPVLRGGLRPPAEILRGMR